MKLPQNIAFLCVTALLLTSCSEQLETTQAQSLSMSDINDSGQEAELEELIEAWETVTEETCETHITRAHDYDALRASCSTNTVLSVYDSASALKDNIHQIDELNSSVSMEGEWLVGPNWTVNTKEKHFEDLHHKLGGVAVTLGY